MISINGISQTQSILRDGDTITLGAVALRFGFSPVRQRGAGLREWLTWLGLAALCLSQIALIYQLNR